MQQIMDEANASTHFAELSPCCDTRNGFIHLNGRDIVFEVDAKGGAVYPRKCMFMAQIAAMPIISVPSKVEVNEEGKGKVTFTNDALKNAKTWDDTFTNQISVDWNRSILKLNLYLHSIKRQDKYKSMYVELSVKAPADLLHH